MEITGHLSTGFTRFWIRLLQCILSKIEMLIVDIQALFSLLKHFFDCNRIFKLSELRILVDILV